MTSETAAGSFTTLMFSVSPGQLELGSPKNATGPTVGICLSGGGSRAFAAGIGQLQALQAITDNGSNLLSQITYMTTVSGGGWIGIPFTYKPESLSDADFLGTYSLPSSLTLSSINELSPDGIATHITSGFSIPGLAAKAFVLYKDYGVPAEMLWQVLMAIHFLQPFGLYQDSDWIPTDFFCYDQTTLDVFVLQHNPSLVNETCYLANPDGRPVLISMASMSVQLSDPPTTQRLVPVTSSSLITGVLSNPLGLQLQVGGGGILSFSFNSSALSFSGDQATIQQTRQWSLTDILGTSSAAFAEELIKTFQQWVASPELFAATLEKNKADIIHRLGRSPEEKANLEAFIDQTATAVLLRDADPSGAYSTLKKLGSPASIVPKYLYWPVSEPRQPGGQVFEFADGGSLENSGVAAMLASSADRIVAFINSMVPMQRVGQNTVLDTCVPPLFGYQPWNDKTSEYELYGPGSDPKVAIYSNNQVFASDDFQALQDGLWQASGNGAKSSYPIFVQNLVTVHNRWFGIPPGKQVTIVWMYLDVTNDWTEQLEEEIKLLLRLDPRFAKFPNYSTDDTELDAAQINLLSNLTAWAVQNNSDVITKLFT